MKNLLLYSLLAVTMLIATALRSAEIIPVWNKTVEGLVQDMDFLKGQTEILMLVGEGSNGQIQIRNPENGELISSFQQPLSTGSKFALTPDSMRFVQVDGNGGALRSIDENFTILESFEVQQEDSITIYFTLVAIDPTRPYAYVTTYGWNKNTNQYAPRGKVIAYNYETGEKVKDLTPYGADEYTAIAVSADGKYLATLNDNRAYLKVWDLGTMEQIINEPLFDPNSDDRCEAQDIYFSKVNPDVIYYSGLFTKKVNGDRENGNFTFNLKTKEKLRIVKSGLYDGYKMIFFDDETRILNTTNGVICVINIPNNEVEYYGNPSVNKEIAIYNSNGDYFIGSSGKFLSRYIYDRQTSVANGYDEEIIVSPNPTSSIVTIQLTCTDPQISYQINNSEGLQLLQDTVNNNGSLQINFSSYPTGVYFLTLHCNNQPKTYKIIKEG